MRALTLVHRWLGVAFCLLFAMWFASGIVMHFVPFPALTEAERIAGLAPIDLSQVVRDAPEAAGRLKDATRVRLLQRVDGPVYVVSGASRMSALRAADLSDAAVSSDRAALAIAVDHARRRGLDVARATFAELAMHDQWTVSNVLDRHRPLYRVSLNDDAGSELYVSSKTGEVVRDTTRFERWWNYAGSVAHWIYPTVLRSRAQAWELTVWLLSLVALVAASCGALLGTLRIEVVRNRLVSPYRGWHAWHHWLGLACMTFVLTWIFSGWLSLDSGRLFSTGRLSDAERERISGRVDWNAGSARDPRQISTQGREVEWSNGLRSAARFTAASVSRSTASVYSRTRRAGSANSSRRPRSTPSSPGSHPDVKAPRPFRARIPMRCCRRCLARRSTARSAARSGFTSTPRAARSSNGSMRRGAPIAGSTRPCTRWIFRSLRPGPCYAPRSW